MSTLSTLLLIAGCILLIGVGLMSLIHDLLGRGPHDAPQIEDEASRRPRYQGAGSPVDPSSAARRVDIEPCSGSRR